MLNLAEKLNIRTGITALIGGGGKTSLMYALAEELSRRGTVIVCTSTKIWPPDHLPCFDGSSIREISEALERTPCICAGVKNTENKFTSPLIPIPDLAKLADYVIVEADGSKRRPLKAHASYEPVIPENTDQTVLVIGADGLGKPVAEAVHRPEIFLERLGLPKDASADPGYVARFVTEENLHDRVFINQAETPEKLRLAEELAGKLNCPVAVGSIQGGTAVCW